MYVLRGVAAALAGVERGLAVFALPPGGRRPEPGWHQRCTTEPAAVHRMWAAGHNIGVGCRACDVVGIDLDRHPDMDGAAAFAALCAAHRAGWPDTLTVATPRGRHLYFRAGGRPIASTSGRRSPLGVGVDVRGPGRRLGGYLVGQDPLSTTGRTRSSATPPSRNFRRGWSPCSPPTTQPTTSPAIDPKEQRWTPTRR
jgi:hypothetical protein